MFVPCRKPEKNNYLDENNVFRITYILISIFKRDKTHGNIKLTTFMTTSAIWISRPISSSSNEENSR